MSFGRALDAVGRLSLAFVRLLKAGGVIVNEHVLSLEQTRRHVEALGRWFDFIHLSDLPKRIVQFRPSRGIGVGIVILAVALLCATVPERLAPYDRASLRASWRGGRPEQR